MFHDPGKLFRLVCVLAASLITASLSGCNPADPLELLSCSFRVESTESFTVAGIELDDLGSLGPDQIADVLYYWSSGTCPVTFTLNVGVQNPNDGSGGTGGFPATLSGFDWDLYLDADSGDSWDTTWVASGSLADPWTIPGDGETHLLVLDIAFDALMLADAMGPMAFIDLALAVGGIDSELRDADHLGRLLIGADVEIGTPIGEIEYPGTLWIHLDWNNGQEGD